MKMTPGPWIVSIYRSHKENKPQYDIESITGLPICIMSDVSKQPVETNAQAIAALPELLAAAEMILEVWDAIIDKNVDASVELQHLWDAIQKAKGETTG